MPICHKLRSTCGIDCPAVQASLFVMEVVLVVGLFLGLAAALLLWLGCFWTVLRLCLQRPLALGRRSWKLISRVAPMLLVRAHVRQFFAARVLCALSEALLDRTCLALVLFRGVACVLACSSEVLLDRTLLFRGVASVLFPRSCVLFRGVALSELNAQKKISYFALLVLLLCANLNYRIRVCITECEFALVTTY